MEFEMSCIQSATCASLIPRQESNNLFVVCVQAFSFQRRQDSISQVVWWWILMKSMLAAVNDNYRSWDIIHPFLYPSSIATIMEFIPVNSMMRNTHQSRQIITLVKNYHKLRCWIKSGLYFARQIMMVSEMPCEEILRYLSMVGSCAVRRCIHYVNTELVALVLDWGYGGGVDND